MGVLYILDEPSIGLHPRDHDRLLATLLRLRDLGNSVLVVEHDEETIRAADWIVEIGPGAGEQGGRWSPTARSRSSWSEPRIAHRPVSAAASGASPCPSAAARAAASACGSRARASTTSSRSTSACRSARSICVTGVSGSGKSSLITDTLYPRLAQVLFNARQRAGRARQHLWHRAPRQGDRHRPVADRPHAALEPGDLHQAVRPDPPAVCPDARGARAAYDASRFSFNVKGGRCEHCAGEGLMQIEMRFLPDLFMPCEVCGGTRYNRETLDIRYRSKNIAEVLDMTVEEAARFFERVPSIPREARDAARRGPGLHQAGPVRHHSLGRRGPADQAGGRARAPRHGPHAAISSMSRPPACISPTSSGCSRCCIAWSTRATRVLVIEHNLDVIKTADWIVDMGPEGGAAGGYVVAEGTPEQIVQVAGVVYWGGAAADPGIGQEIKTKEKRVSGLGLAGLSSLAERETCAPASGKAAIRSRRRARGGAVPLTRPLGTHGALRSEESGHRTSAH